MQSTTAGNAGGVALSAGEGWAGPANLRLFRRWRHPIGPADLRLIVLHGYGDHSGRFLHLMDWLADRGVACDAVDLRGHGRSPGKRGYVKAWPEYLDDVRTAVAAERSSADAAGIAGRTLFVLGHSHGGLVAAAAGVRGLLEEARAVGCVLTAPYLRPAERLTWPWRVIAGVTNVLAPSLRVSNRLEADMMSSDPAMVADSRADPLLLRSATPRWYATTLAEQDEVLASAGRFRVPLLCLIGDADQIASLDAARRFVAEAGSTDKAFEVVPAARHEVLRETSRERTFERILAWMQERAAGAGSVSSE